MTISGLAILARPVDSATVGMAVVLGMLIAAPGAAVPAATAFTGFAVGFLLLAGIDTLNDAADAQIDAEASPHRPIPRGRVTRRTAVAAGWSEIGVGLVLAATLSAVALSIAAAGAVLGVAYSRRLADVFVVKNLTVAGTLTLAIVGGGAVITFDWPPLLWRLLPVAFASVFAFEVHKDVRDAAADRRRGRRTIPNTVSRRTADVVVAGCYLTAYGLAWSLAWGETGVVYVGTLVAVGPVLGAGMMMMRSRSPGMLRASFATTNLAILAVLAALAVDVLRS